tara:strand:+ start:650 stop:811 length:162 start_codon:yes stop_codon:yes gene_type:complete
MKVCLIGDTGVGKSCMSNNMVGNQFNQFSLNTLIFGTIMETFNFPSELKLIGK